MLHKLSRIPYRILLLSVNLHYNKLNNSPTAWRGCSASLLIEWHITAHILRINWVIFVGHILFSNDGSRINLLVRVPLKTRVWKKNWRSSSCYVLIHSGWNRSEYICNYSRKVVAKHGIQRSLSLRKLWKLTRPSGRIFCIILFVVRTITVHKG